MTIGHFLGGVAALIRNPEDSTYLLLQRAADRDAGAGHWECVTGRVDQGEGYEAALRREVHEEINVDITIEFIIGTSHFYRGAHIPDNELLGVLYACRMNNPDAFRLSVEHSTYRWMQAEAVYDFLPAKHWLVRTIRRAELMHQWLPSTLLETFHRDGFEMS